LISGVAGAIQADIICLGKEMKYQTKLLIAAVALVTLFYFYRGGRGYEPFQGTPAAEKVVKLRIKKCAVDSDCPARFECKNEKCVDTRMP
jgi:hypothetical protein